MTGHIYFWLTFLFDHTASIKNGTCYVSKTNGFEIRPSPCQKTIGWPHRSRFASAWTHIWSKTAVRPQTGPYFNSRSTLFFSAVWKAFCLRVPLNSRTNCIIERREIGQRARCSTEQLLKIMTSTANKLNNKVLQGFYAWGNKWCCDVPYKDPVCSFQTCLKWRRRDNDSVFRERTASQPHG